MSRKLVTDSDRLVWTYTVDGLPVGVLTAFERDGGAYLEHLIALPGMKPLVLVEMLTFAIQVGWDHGYQFIALMVANDYPRARKLQRLAERFGFTKYAEVEGVPHYVLRRP